MPLDLVHPTTKESFRPGKIVCIGRNYAKHIEELENERPSSPVIFLKPSSSLVPNGGKTIIPSYSKSVHHEIELVCLIGKTGKDIHLRDASNHIDGYAAGIDFTARDLQSAAKEKSLPWSISKGIDTFAPIGDFSPASEIDDVQNLGIQLLKNGDVMQEGNTKEMLWPIFELIAGKGRPRLLRNAFWSWACQGRR